MAKLRLDGTSRAPSPYSEFTKNYRMSSDIEDRRGPEFEDARNNAAKDLFLNSFPSDNQKIDRLPEKFDKLPPMMEEYINNSKKK